MLLVEVSSKFMFGLHTKSISTGKVSKRKPFAFLKIMFSEYMYSLRWESLKFRFKPSSVKWGHILHKLAKAKSPTDGKQNPNFEVTPPSKLLTVNTAYTVNC